MSESQPKHKKRKSGLTGNSSLSESLSFDHGRENVLYAGRVHSLQMVNFMCHSNLQISFNPRVNFISGRNGSGKSAIMAALVVVLGGTAVNTQRASSVAEFIKKGENSGRVTIELLNEGVNAYRPDVFGNRIIITRSFSKAGSNSYVVKSANNEVVAKKRSEVQKICEILRLDVTNPICVLNQDVARSFLTSSDSKLRYKLFMKATQLEEVRNLHNKTVDELSESFADLERKSVLLENAKKEAETLKTKLNFMITLEKITEERRDLENEFVWAGVVAEEETLKSIVAEKAALERKLEEIANSNRDYNGRMDELKEELNELKIELSNASTEKKKVIEERRPFHERFLKMGQEITRLQVQLDLTLPKLERTLEDVKRVTDYMLEVDDRNKRAADEKEKLSEKIRKYQLELKATEESYSAAERDMANAEETRARMMDNLRSVGNTIKDLNHNKDHKIVQLDGMRGQKDMGSVKFGAYVPDLLREIDNAVARKQFQRKPIGPLGMHIKLNCDLKWAPAIESVIGSLMAAFCVDNNKDFQTLEQIMNRVGITRPPTIIISKYQMQRHNVNNNCVSLPGFLSLLDALSISDNTVFNTLVDQARVEGILLLEKDDQAHEMLTYVENVPRNLRMAVTMNADRYYPAPNYKTYAGRCQPKFFNQPGRKEDVVKKLETTITDITRELDGHVQEQKRFREELKQIDEFEKKARMRLRELREKKDELKIELITMKDQENVLPVPRTRLVLEEELETLEKKRLHLEAERQSKRDKMKEYEVTRDAARLELQVHNQKMDNTDLLVLELEKKVAANDDAKKALSFIHKNSEDQKTKLKEQLLNNERRKILTEDDLKHRTIEAEAICPERVETTKSLKEISSLLEQKEKYLRAVQKMSGTKEEVMAEYREKKEACEAKEKEQDRIREHIAFFSESANRRMDMYVEKRQVSARDVSNYFRSSLLTRGYDGLLKFDFDDEQLDLEVQPRRDDILDKRTDTKTLSGGERSYSTVSFILAIWRALVMPFYFLDEFDVFMDKVNRKIVMDLLLAYASENGNTQFVFITPQDVSSITTSDAVSVFIMPDPVRTGC